jgi:predicted nucleic acid-binding protein
VNFLLGTNVVSEWTKPRPDPGVVTWLAAADEDRLLAVDAETANGWGRVMARGQAGGRPVSTMDAFIAATADRHDLTLVTRNISNFSALGIRLVNPWSTD